MPLLIPAAVNYPSLLIGNPSASQDEPIEGRKQIACEILWASMGGAAKCVAINVQNNTTLAFTQISSLKVDNSQSGADVQFIFPDTSEVITIPAKTPLSVVPVFSNALQFFVSSPGATANDVTRFLILNYLLDPAAVDITQSAVLVQSSSALWNAATPVVTQLINAGVNGTINVFQLGVVQQAQFAAGTPPVGTFQLADGSGNVLFASWKIQGTTYPPIFISQANIRFQNGLISTFNTLQNWGGGVYANFLLTYTSP